MEKILILDYGSQYTQLIARAVRDLRVYCEIHPHDWPADKILAFDACGVILSGGPRSATEKDAYPLADDIFQLQKPILGICYGMQAIALRACGATTGDVIPDKKREYGRAKISLTEDGKNMSTLLDFLKKADPKDEDDVVWMSHGDHITRAPDGFMVIAKSDSVPIAAFANDEKKIYGLQFHPEVAHTRCGKEILKCFVRDICATSGQWTMPNFVSRETAHIRDRVGKDGVLLGLSGGVDSSVMAALLNHAIGKQLTCVLVDHGLMREGEAAQVREVFENHFSARLIVVDAAKRFFDALASISEPEEKRRRIGKLFVEVFEEEAKKHGDNVRWLAQGTIYPDVVESAKTGTGKAVIKTHHNVGGLPEKLNLRLLEPLRELFKDEVRCLGNALGLPAAMVNRHPFPGPGLAVRVLGEVTKERVEIARRADAIFMCRLREAGLYGSAAQAFAVLLPVRSVGVMGDNRTYENVVALRAVSTDDFMTADWVRLDGNFLADVSSRIINEVPGINRVVYDISSKPPATVEWE